MPQEAARENMVPGTELRLPGKTFTCYQLTSVIREQHCARRKRPADRPQSAEEVLHELEIMVVVASGGTVAAHPAESAVQPMTVRRGPLGHHVALYLGLAALLGLVAYAGLAGIADRQVGGKPPAARRAAPQYKRVP